MKTDETKGVESKSESAIELSSESAELRLALAFQKIDVMAELLADKRSLNTRTAYAKDLRDFFRFAASVASPTPELVTQFLQLEQFDAIALVLKYKSHLLNERGLKEATVNRRLAALKALVNFARKLGKCNYTLP